MGFERIVVLLCRNTDGEDGREGGGGWARRPSGGPRTRRMDMVLGIESPAVWLAYVLSLASAAGCVVYGVVNWNKGEEPVKKEDVDWAQEEKSEVEDAL